MYVDGDNGSTYHDVTYFDNFGVEHIPKEIKKKLGNKNITANIFRIQAYNQIMCGYFCIEYTNLFFPNEYQKNDKIILKYFQ